MPTEQATVEQHEWLEEPSELELPRRPRRRLLTPIPLALTAVLLIACGFIGGVLVEKGQSSSASSAGASGFAARFASLRGASGGSGGGVAGSSSGAAGASTGSGGGRATSLFGAGSAGGTGPTGSASGLGATIGQVAYVSGSTLYVTDTEGNTVKVKTSDASTVSKTVKSDVKGIHPGETVIVTGSTGSSGAVQAESIRVSEAGASGGGLGALFGGGRRGGLSNSQGGGGSSSGGATGSGGGATSSGGEPALFGK